MFLSKKIPPPIVTLIFGALIYCSAEYFYQFYFVYQAIVSFVIALIGTCILSVAIVQFKQFKTTVNPLKPESASALVTNGIFKFSRNPMYLGMLLLIISLWIKTGAVAGFVLLPCYVAYLNYFQIASEERAMRKLFTDSYDAYCQRARRWI
ncbi:MAG: isoprenylcysteine carboxylmethyltransferase family protein [Porticoccaceae bacterium]|nr:isoprenylcysteine carboxylmethyltransferase family protein [Porticoccaceae bacterium]